MTSVKFKFRASTVRGREGMLHLQIIHNRSIRRINTGHRLHATEWNAEAMQVIVPATGDRADYLHDLQQTLEQDLHNMQLIIHHLESRGEDFTADYLIDLYTRKDGGIHFLLAFGHMLIEQLHRNGHHRTAETYAVAMSSFERFRGGHDIVIDEMDSDLMMAYENHLRQSGICPNTISFYMRNLRAIYNRAAEKGLTGQRNPFRHVYTGIDKTRKRAVDIGVVRRIRDLDLRMRPSLAFARDIFMFSFYTRGMSFVDIAYLKKSDLHNGVLTYRRKKTGQQLLVKWEQPMQDITGRHGGAPGSPYLLAIIGHAGQDERTQYRNATRRVNHALKHIGRMLGLASPLTTYVARHCWASIARSRNVAVSVISEAMGHDSESTTRIYLASLDTSVVDKANSLIMEAL